MTSSLVAPSTQTKGAVFEFVVKKLLEMNDYEKCQPDNEQVDINGRIRGRGEWHQIDAFGRWKYTIPFVYPIRLLCEAKCWTKRVDLPVIRNFVGVVKDISENYFVEDNQDIDKKMLSKRHTDCGAVFSVSGYTERAQRYAYAQNVFLVSYDNNPIINKFKKTIEDIALFSRLASSKDKKDFSKWLEDTLTGYTHNQPPNRFLLDREGFEKSAAVLREEFGRIRTSIVGIATGVYPIHLLSYNEIPKGLFRDRDEVNFRTAPRKTENGGFYFEIFPSNSPHKQHFNFRIKKGYQSIYGGIESNIPDWAFTRLTDASPC